MPRVHASQGHSPAGGVNSRFAAWKAERLACDVALERAPEESAQRAALLDRLYQLERLIIETPSLEPEAMAVKAEILLWYMEMEQADGLPAMRHIRDFLDQQH